MHASLIVVYGQKHRSTLWSVWVDFCWSLKALLKRKDVTYQFRSLIGIKFVSLSTTGPNDEIHTTGAHLSLFSRVRRLLYCDLLLVKSWKSKNGVLICHYFWRHVGSHTAISLRRNRGNQKPRGPDLRKLVGRGTHANAGRVGCCLKRSGAFFTCLHVAHSSST